MRRHDSVDLKPQKLAEFAREVDVSDARELVYEFFSVEDRGIVGIEAAFVRVPQLLDPGFWNKPLAAVFDGPNIIASAFRQQHQSVATIHVFRTESEHRWGTARRF